MFTAIFLLCSQAYVCEPFIDDREFGTKESCVQGGTYLYNDVIESAKDDDFVVGDCIESPVKLSKKEYTELAEKKLLGPLFPKDTI